MSIPCLQEHWMEERSRCDFACQMQLPFDAEPEPDSLLLPAPLPVGHKQQASHRQETSKPMLDSVQKSRLPRHPPRVLESLGPSPHARDAMRDLFSVPFAVSVCKMKERDGIKPHLKQAQGPTATAQMKSSTKILCSL